MRLSGSFPIAAIRQISTDGTKSWVSTKLYSGSLTTNASWAASGTDDILGSYLDMTAGPLGTADNGTIAICNSGGVTQAIMELDTTAPHGLKTGQYVYVGPTSYSLSQAAISGTTVTYTGTFPFGGSNGLAGASVSISGFTHSGNNGTFTVTSSTATTAVVTNASGVNETHSGTLSTIAPTLPFSQSGSIQLPAGVDFPVMVTGPDTFMINNAYLQNPNNGSSETQTINSSSEISTPGLIGSLSCPWQYNFTPYEAFFRFVARFPGAIAWLNVSPLGSHAYIQHVISLAAEYLSSTNKLYLEWGNEPWNTNGTAGYQCSGRESRGDSASTPHLINRS